MHVERSTEINATPQAVWDLTIDFRRISELAPDTAEEVTYVSEGAVGVGSVFRERVRIGPMRSETEWRVTEFDPPRRHVHVGATGPLKEVVATEIEPTDQGTLLRHVVDVQATGLLRPVGWLLDALVLRRKMVSTLQATQSSVKKIVEAERS